MPKKPTTTPAKKTRSSTPSFIAECPLIVDVASERELLIRFELARQLYNATLGEALYRLGRVRASKEFSEAKLEKNKTKANEKFREADKKYKFSEYELQAFSSECIKKAKWNLQVKDFKGKNITRISSKLAEKIAQKVFSSVKQHAFGKKGCPRFISKNNPLKSMESKTNVEGIVWKKELGIVSWSNLTLQVLQPPCGKDPWLDEALQCRTKYARILWRMIKGQRRWFVQLTQEGVSPQKYIRGTGKVGMDVGPSSIAIYAVNGMGEPVASYESIAPEVLQPWTDIAKLQRLMDRSRRATNPQCYHPNGTFKKGQKITTRSKRYERIRNKIAEKERILAVKRKRSHGRLSNQILAQGVKIQTEKLSYLSFQKNFGRSTKVRGTGSLMTMIQQKVKSAGGTWIELDTRALKLSQYNHVTQSYTKKPLSQRWHWLENAERDIVQRDLYSAYLAFNVDINAVKGSGKQTIHPSQLGSEINWLSAKTLLIHAGWMCKAPFGVQLGSTRGFPRITPHATLPSPKKRWAKEVGRQTQSHEKDLQTLMQDPGLAQIECVDARATQDSSKEVKITCNTHVTVNSDACDVSGPTRKFRYDLKVNSDACDVSVVVPLDLREVMVNSDACDVSGHAEKRAV